MHDTRNECRRHKASLATAGCVSGNKAKSRNGVVGASVIPAHRFEIYNDGPRRWVLVDNESDDGFCFVYSSEKKARAAARAQR